MGLRKLVDCVQALYKGDDELEDTKNLKTGDNIRLEVLPKSNDEEDGLEEKADEPKEEVKKSLMSKPVLKSAKINLNKVRVPVNKKIEEPKPVEENQEQENDSKPEKVEKEDNEDSEHKSEVKKPMLNKLQGTKIKLKPQIKP